MYYRTVSIFGMNSFLVTIISASVVLVAGRATIAEDTVKIDSSSPFNRFLNDQIVLHVPDKKPAGLLVLLAGDIHGFEKPSSYPPSSLPEKLTSNGVMTVVTSPRPGQGARDPVLQELNGLIGTVLDRYGMPNRGVAIGGFSGGGIVAVRYAQFWAKGKSKIKGPIPVFAVDSPLDFERWFMAADLHLKRLALAGLDLAEDRSVVETLTNLFGGSPAQATEAYRRQSPVSIFVGDGGNARLLKETPIRLYIEPEINWRLENWHRDVFSSNITDATTLINVVRLLGNTKATLITTSGKGYRPDGSRNPHSWSIVDERDLAEWLTANLARLP